MKGIRILFLTVMFALVTILLTPITTTAGESRAGPEGSIVLLMDADYQFTMNTLEVLAPESALSDGVSWFHEYAEPVPVGRDQSTTFDNTLPAIPTCSLTKEHRWQVTSMSDIRLRKLVDSLAKYDTIYARQGGLNTPKFQEVGSLSLLRHTLVPRAVT